MRIDKACGTGVFVDGHLKRIDLRAQCRMHTHIVDDHAHARQQPGIIQHWLAHRDAVHVELAGFPDQPGRLSKCSYWNRSIIGGHTPEFVTGYDRRLRTEICRAQCGEHTRGTGTNNDDI